MSEYYESLDIEGKKRYKLKIEVTRLSIKDDPHNEGNYARYSAK